MSDRKKRPPSSRARDGRRGSTASQRRSAADRRSSADGRSAPEPARSGGILGRLLGPPVPPALSEMPTFRDSLGQGFLLVMSNPVLLFAPFVLVFVVWVVLLAFGSVPPPISLTQILALPPVSTEFDTQNAIAIVGERGGLIVGLALLLVRAAIVALLAAATIEGFERGGRIGPSALPRAARAFPSALAFAILSFTALFFAGQVASVFAGGIGLLAEVALPAVVLYLLGFIPFAAVRARWPLVDTLRASFHGARTPGGRQLIFCMLYVLLGFVLRFFVPGVFSIEANLSPATWTALVLLAFLHVGFTAAFAYRWLAVEPLVTPSGADEG